MRRGNKGFGVRVGDVGPQTLTSLGCLGVRSVTQPWDLVVVVVVGGQQYSPCF